MTHPDQRERDHEALQERLTRLSEASLRINESLDFDEVLQGVLDAARSLTAARYGVMTLLDDAGGVRDFLASGMTAGEAGQLWLTPDRWRIFESLTALSEPLRVPDLAAHVRAQGFPEFSIPLPVGVFRFMAAPLSHRGGRVGHLFVGDKEGGRSSRAPTRTRRDIRLAGGVRDRQRAHSPRGAPGPGRPGNALSASPVGVAVSTRARARRSPSPRWGVGWRRTPRGGVPRRVRRWSPGAPAMTGPPSRLPRSMRRRSRLRSCCAGEALGPAELAGQGLAGGQARQAAYCGCRTPRWRAGEHTERRDYASTGRVAQRTPIHLNGALASFMVTLQDLTPLEEQERLRADFLAMVSHELRTPLAAVKGSVTTLLEQGGELDPAEVTQFHRIIRDHSDQMRELIGDLLDVARIETGALPVEPEPADLRLLVDEAAGRFRAAGAAHPLELELDADLPLVMADRRRILQVLGNLLSNAARSSPGDSPITVSAARDGVRVAVSVSDQGRGIPAELLPELFRKFPRAFSAGHAGSADGSGLGLAICRGIVEAHGGRIRAESDGPGLGARFSFTLPAVAATPAPPPASARLRGRPPAGCACWPWTTTPRTCATSAMSSPRRATPRS